MDKNLSDKTEKRISLNGLFVIIALLALYGVSCTAIKSWQIYTDEFWGIIELGIFSTIISAIWIFLYWFLDRIKHESLKMTVLTFFLGEAAYLSGKGILNWIVGKESFALMENIGLPVFAFFLIFTFVVVKLSSFDELVDSFIYGGFLGTGIAFSACMTEFVNFESLDGQFVIIELITRISVYAAICSLSGFLIHQSLLRKRIVRLILAVLVMIMLFALNYGIEQFFLKDISFAGIKILPVLISIAFATVLVLAVVVLIHKILKKEGEISPEFLTIPKSRATSAIMIFMLCAFLIYALVIRYGEFRTEKFVSSDGKWTFCLPFDFSRVEESSTKNAFDLSSETENVFYKNKTGSINLYLFCDAKTDFVKITKPVNLGMEKGWEISAGFNSFVAKDSAGKPFVLYQKTYKIKKGESEFLIDVFSDKEQDDEANRAVRILIRTLEAKND